MLIKAAKVSLIRKNELAFILQVDAAATEILGWTPEEMVGRRTLEFIDPEDGHSITVGRAEAWREEYQARVERHRAEIRAETDRLGWSFIIHRTDRPASDLLLKLHAQLGGGREGTGINRWHGAGLPGRHV